MKRKRRSGRKNRRVNSDESLDSDSHSSSQSSRERERWLAEKWAFAEQRKAVDNNKWREDVSRIEDHKRWDRRVWCFLGASPRIVEYRLFLLFAWSESFFANLPLTIGAIALSIANLGVVWFKFAEENMASCTPVHFHSKQCSFPEVRFLPCRALPRVVPRTT